MPDVARLAIKTLGVDAIQLPHALGKITVRRFDHQVIVVIHQTIGRHGPVANLHHFGHHVEKQVFIRLAQENSLPSISAGGDVIQRTGKFDS